MMFMFSLFQLFNNFNILFFSSSYKTRNIVHLAAEWLKTEDADVYLFPRVTIAVIWFQENTVLSAADG